MIHLVTIPFLFGYTDGQSLLKSCKTCKNVQIFLAQDITWKNTSESSNLSEKCFCPIVLLPYTHRGENDHKSS